MNNVTINEAKLTRVEVINENGRKYVRWGDDYNVELCVQDNERILTIFITAKRKILKP